MTSVDKYFKQNEVPRYVIQLLVYKQYLWNPLDARVVYERHKTYEFTTLRVIYDKTYRHYSSKGTKFLVCELYPQVNYRVGKYWSYSLQGNYVLLK